MGKKHNEAEKRYLPLFNVVYIKAFPHLRYGIKEQLPVLISIEYLSALISSEEDMQ
jgi:hypothetical protein